ncbi:MAG: lipid-A-disaccharide synthase, partial [Hyphomicrobiaceae bacterium]
GYIDHVLGLLPFEPKTHQDLGGPPCSYVGHPLSEKIGWMQTLPTHSLEKQLQLGSGKPVIVVLPGSRSSEVRRLMPVFAETLNRLNAVGADFEAIIPAVPHVRHLIDAALKKSGARAFVVEGHEAKYQAFRLATCALAASGTVSLELALAGTPMVVGYRVDPLATGVRYLITAHSVVLPNLILANNAVPEFMQEDCTPENLSTALQPLLFREEAYDAQRAALRQVQARIRMPEQTEPSDAAAAIVYHYATNGVPRPQPESPAGNI